MSRWILDCSTTMAWCFPDESSPRADAALDRLDNDEAIVPALWPFEVLNVMLIGEKRGRIKAERIEQFVAFLQTLNILVEQTVSLKAQETLLNLARKYRLTVYDAAYLDLAMRHNLPLATLDEELSAAATQAGIPLICPPKV